MGGRAEPEVEYVCRLKAEQNDTLNLGLTWFYFIKYFVTSCTVMSDFEGCGQLVVNVCVHVHAKPLLHLPATSDREAVLLQVT